MLPAPRARSPADGAWIASLGCDGLLGAVAAVGAGVDGVSEVTPDVGVDLLQLADGRKVNWRRDLASRLMDFQKADGSWINDNSRWWEKDPVLVTSYAVLTLETVFRGL
jgi:hypothetical protein